MTSQSYAHEKLSVAVEAMASSAASIQNRLWYAYSSFHTLKDSDFSNAADQAKWKSIMERLTAIKTGDPDKGYVKNTLEQMTDQQAERLSEDIYSLFDSVRL